MKKWILLTALTVVFCFICSPVATAKNSIKALRALEADFDPLIDELTRRLQQDRFKEVERYVDDLLKREARAPSGIPLLDLVYQDLGKKRDIGVYLDKWCRTSVHQSAFITRGMQRVEDAWRVRGGDWGYTVSKAHSELFQEKLQQAAADFVTGHTINPQDPNAASGMLRVCIGSGCSKQEKEEWFEAAIAADPTTYFPYFYKFEYLAHKWGGNFREQTAFVRDCYENTPAGGIAYTLMLDYLRATARSSKNMKSFYSRPEVWQVIEDVMTRWETEYPGALSQYRWRAHFQEELGNYQQALAYLNQALVKYPNSTRELKSRGDIYFYNLRQMINAKADYAKVLELNPTDDLTLCSMGRIYQHLDRDYEKAIEYYDKAISLNPRNKWFFYYRGDANIWQQKYPEAIESLNQAIRIDPYLKKAYYARGRAYAKMWKHRQAIKDFNTAISIDPKYGMAYYERGYSHACLEEYEMAKKDFLATREHSSAYAHSAQRHLKELENGTGPWKVAAKSAKAKKSNRASLVSKTQIQSAKTPQPKEAGSASSAKPKKSKSPAPAPVKRSQPTKNRQPGIAATAKTTKSQKDVTTSLQPKEKARSAAARQTSRGESATPPEADKTHQAAAASPKKVIPAESLQLNPAESYLFEGKEQFRRNMYKLAKPHFEKVLEIDPENHVALYHLGFITYRVEKDYPKALDYCNKALQGDSSRAEYYSLRGDIFYRVKQYETARKEYEKALSIDEYERRALYGLGHIYESKIVDYEKAFVCYDKLSELSPDNTSFLHARSMCKFRQKDYRAAIESFDRLLEVDPQDCGALLWTGYCYKYLGEKAKAIDHFRKTVKYCGKTSTTAYRELQTLSAE